ncbi:MAG: hypothetical protein K8R99_11625 [Actinomycetia bacterium]|nr:hypothetical protein [Actinomycetes bacterium]
MSDGVIVRGLRPAGEGDDEAIAALFDATLLLGAPMPRPLAGAAGYRHVCLGWYLGPGRADAAVAVSAEGDVVGYALVCVDEAAQAQWVRRELTRFTIRMLGRLITFRIDPASLRFWWSRTRDVVTLRKSRQQVPMPVHAHLNVATRSRSGTTALALRDHISARCIAAGQPGWYGEMNALHGHRARALERIGIETVARARNHTLSSTLGVPVDRLTIVHRLAPQN